MRLTFGIPLLLSVGLAVLASSTASADSELTQPGRSPKVFVPSKRHIFGTQWSAPIVRSGYSRTVPVSLGSPGVASAQGVVIVGTGEGELRGYRLASGELLWAKDYKVPFLGPITVLHGGDPFAVTTIADGTLIAFEITNGELRWQTELDGESLAPVRLAGDRLILSTTENKVSAIALTTGERLWTAGRPKATNLSVRGHSAPAVEGDAVFATFSDGYVECYSASEGTTLWSRPLALGGDDFNDSDADPVLIDGTLYVASYSAGVYALSPADGKTVWSQEAPAVTSLTAYNDLVIAGSADGYLWGLAATDGELRYRVTMPPGSASRMYLSDDLLLFTSGDSGLIAMRAGSGEPLQATPLLGRAGGAPDVDGEFVSAISSRGYIYVMRRGAAGWVTSRSNWGRP
ncbi:MAG: PQQ-binding-like beta-propeller repeat protein [Myxococcota bacterium]